MPLRVGRQTTDSKLKADHADLINHYATKKENIIVHCMAASGCKPHPFNVDPAHSSAAPTADKCVDLNVEADPEGDRTMSKPTPINQLNDQLISSRDDQSGSNRGP
jgi:hypothetical protein